MNVRSGMPYWVRKNGWPQFYPPLAADLVCDVAVMGGGISGALVAHRLAQHGIAVVVVDRRDIGEGSTAASTCLLQYETDAELLELAKRYGQSVAQRVYRAGLEAIDELDALAANLDEPCDFRRRPSLYLASSAQDARRLHEEFQFRRRAGFEVQWWTETTIAERTPFTAPAAIFSQGDAEVDAFLLTHALLKQALLLGARVFDRTEVHKVDVNDDGNWVRLTTNSGSIRARKLVYATGYESGKHLPRSIGTLHSTYAIATEPTTAVAQLPDRCLVWETSRPYFYLRTTPDGRLIAGGGDTRFSSDHRRDRLVERKTRDLEQRLEQLFPASPPATACAWAGTFGESPDGLPLIGSPREMPWAYFALGYGGNGITFSMLAAQIITDLFLGRVNPDAAIFGFSRLNL